MSYYFSRLPWQLFGACSVLFPLVFPKVELVPADPDVCPLGPQLWQEGSDLLGVEFVGAVAKEGAYFVITRGPDPVDCPKPGRVWKKENTK